MRDPKKTLLTLIRNPRFDCVCPSTRPSINWFFLPMSHEEPHTTSVRIFLIDSFVFNLSINVKYYC